MDYSYIIIPIIVLLTSQAIKLTTDGIKGNFDFRNIFISYGGMPSSHAAFSTAITTLLGLRLGLSSPLFAVSLIFTLLIIRDAIGFRAIIGRQAALLNVLVKRLPASERKNLPDLYERMGHSILEVCAGIGWSVILTYFLSLI